MSGNVREMMAGGSGRGRDWTEGISGNVGKMTAVASERAGERTQEVLGDAEEWMEGGLKKAGDQVKEVSDTASPSRRTIRQRNRRHSNGHHGWTRASIGR